MIEYMVPQKYEYFYQVFLLLQTGIAIEAGNCPVTPALLRLLRMEICEELRYNFDTRRDEYAVTLGAGDAFHLIQM